jgi:hypothetical protein
MLVTLIPFLFLFPLSDLRDLTPSEVLIPGMWVIFFSGNMSVSHGNSLYQLLHGLHHHVELVVGGLRRRWLCISLGSLVASVEP